MLELRYDIWCAFLESYEYSHTYVIKWQNRSQRISEYIILLLIKNTICSYDILAIHICIFRLTNPQCHMIPGPKYINVRLRRLSCRNTLKKHSNIFLKRCHDFHMPILYWFNHRFECLAHPYKCDFILFKIL